MAADSYKQFLQSYLEENKRKGIVAQLASACGCDRTYLSQTLSGKAELTPDHIIQLADYLSLSEVDSRYLLLLLLRDRSASSRVRRRLQSELTKMKQEALVLANQIGVREKPSEVSDKYKMLYYSNWLYGAAHTLTSSPNSQTLQAIAERLHLSLNNTSTILNDLVSMGLVNRESELYVHNGKDIYLSPKSPQTTSNHLNWRMKAVERASCKDDVHYTVAFTVSELDFEEIRTHVLELIEKQRKTVRASGTAVAAVFCCDLFTF